MVGAGGLIQTLFGLPYDYAVWVVGILMILYVSFGGMIATTWVQIIKAILLLLGASILAFLVLISGLIWDNKVDPANAEQISKTAPIEKIAPKVTTKSSSQKINFAKFLSQNNIFMYSAYWCSHCYDQKQLFGQEAVKELSIVECAKDGKDSQTELCIEKEIQGFPSWEINGAIYSGVKNLNELAVMTGYEGDASF